PRRRAARRLPGGAGALPRRRPRHLLPHRRALRPHLVRAHLPPRLPPRAELRRLVDRVGEPRPCPDRAIGGAVDRQTRIALLVDHFRNPRHKHAMDDADVRMPGGNPGCGDVVTVYLKADPDADRVAEVSFEGTGCTISQAAAS